MTQKKSDPPSYSLRLRPEVDVYVAEERKAFFRIGARTAAFTMTDRKVRDLVELANTLDQGLPIEEFARLLETDDEDEVASAVSWLTNIGVLEMLSKESTSAPEEDNIWSHFTRNGMMSGAVARKTLESLHVVLRMPEPVARPISDLFTTHGAAVSILPIEWDEQKRLTLEAPTEEEGRRQVEAIYLIGIDFLYYRDIALQLHKRGIEYLPVHRDHTSPLIVGPYVDRHGPCLSCYMSRVKANMAYPEVVSMIAAPGTVCVRRSKPSHSPVELMMMACSVFHQICWHAFGADIGASAEARRYTCINSWEGTIAKNTLFKVPQCYACGSGGELPGKQEFRPRVVVDEA